MTRKANGNGAESPTLAMFRNNCLSRHPGALTADERVCEKVAADLLGYHPGTLKNKRSQGRGPRSVNIDGAIWYKLSDLADYVDAGSIIHRRPKKPSGAANTKRIDLEWQAPAAGENPNPAPDDILQYYAPPLMFAITNPRWLGVTPEMDKRMQREMRRVDSLQERAREEYERQAEERYQAARAIALIPEAVPREHFDSAAWRRSYFLEYWYYNSSYFRNLADRLRPRGAAKP